ncbi:uncharacterized protein PHACADRAFT_197450 [Phanerochaete carnosa HHB-10118-sp]|uniref:Uncharacterized protein n=1 Tax=Phanerochaete carnosa (strain HHB-10118-sp) TaxID=650164 RepID=K5USV7_PHACS|nr:uncharacterized protein PHACADRAFT_197450 [Phanerochaete carnosa HHB-10118-sp]EKM53021.1 hypothetical protein PHACADRAFT_197450 [Phanerochaete carnosa HHB-10118-sp]
MSAANNPTGLSYDNAEETDKRKPAADLDISVETITIPVDVKKVPDFCIIASDCRPDNANDGRLKTYFLGHKIKKSRVVAIVVECKRHPKRRRPEKFARKLSDYILLGQFHARKQGIVLFSADQGVNKVHLIASGGHYWRHALLTRDNVTEEAGGADATYVDAPQAVQWSKTYEMGTPVSGRKLSLLRRSIREMQEALCRE